MDFKIACRSYDRPKQFYQKSLKMFRNQKGFKEELFYLFLASKEEEIRYKEEIGKSSINYIIGRKGASEINCFIGDFFEEGEPVLYIDDDLCSFLELKENRFHQSDSLIFFCEKGFSLLNENIGAFSFNFLSNSLFIKKRPAITVSFHHLPGTIWGAFHKREISKTKYSHLDDAERTLNIFRKSQQILFFNHVLLTTNYGRNKGGLQTFRNSKNRLEFTESICDNFIKENDDFPLGKKFHKNGDCWEIKYPPVTYFNKLYCKKTSTPISESKKFFLRMSNEK